MSSSTAAPSMRFQVNRYVEICLYSGFTCNILMHVYDIEHNFEFGQWAGYGHLPKCLCTLHLIEKGRKERKWGL